MKNIGKRIEKAREYRDMSRTELGKAVGFPEDSAYRRVLSYEKGERVPKKEMLEEFAKALKIDFIWFNFDDDLQIGNIAYFEKGADPERKEYIRRRLLIEKDIYYNLQKLLPEELDIIIDMIKAHDKDAKVIWNNPAYDIKKRNLSLADYGLYVEQNEKTKSNHVEKKKSKKTENGDE